MNLEFECDRLGRDTVTARYCGLTVTSQAWTLAMALAGARRELDCIVGLFDRAADDVLAREKRS